MIQFEALQALRKTWESLSEKWVHDVLKDDACRLHWMTLTSKSHGLGGRVAAVIALQTSEFRHLQCSS